MTYDVVPTGFSSAAAVTLLKTMQSSMASNSSFIASSDTPSFDTTRKAKVSGDTLFSIIAASAQSKAASAGAASGSPSGSTATPSGNQSAAAASASTGAVGGQTALDTDPYFQKSYTLDQAVATFYAFSEQSAEFTNRTPGGNPTGASAGLLLATSVGLTGDQATSFAAAFDTKTLKFSDPNSIVGLNATFNRTYSHGDDGYVDGETVSYHFNQKAQDDYTSQNSNSRVFSDNFGFKGWQGLLVTW